MSSFIYFGFAAIVALIALLLYLEFGGDEILPEPDEQAVRDPFHEIDTVESVGGPKENLTDKIT